MIVKLPRKCSGEEVIESFKNAFNNAETRFKVEEFVAEHQYEHASVKQTPQSIGVSALPMSFRRADFPFSLFGGKAWREDEKPVFRLSVLKIHNHYTEVDIEIGHKFFCLQEDFFNPFEIGSSAFEKIRPQFERILTRFFSQLQLQNS